LGGEPSRGVRQRQPLKHRRIDPLIEVGCGGERGRELRIDDGVDRNGPLGGGGPELPLRPGELDGIGGGNVEQDVRVEKCHSSPRVSAITSFVLAPGIAAPRAR
jgi:hypothetical protein